ncbi:YaiI/YqxD family protein [bacterium]|nr:YaiI/YqxD family protein [bacterium]
MVEIFVDADGCPVKEDVFRVAHRYAIKVYYVANTVIRPANSPLIESVVVKSGLNVADDWIAENVKAGDVVITSDIPLADRCLAKGAKALGNNGYPFTDKNIGRALASRELGNELRQMGVNTGGPKPFSKEHRSRFLSALDQVLHSAKRDEQRKARPQSSGGTKPPDTKDQEGSVHPPTDD